jgi:hypothetical protein
MQLTSVGQVIATRNIREHGSDEIAYVVKIGLPQRYLDSSDFYCPVQIAGADGEGPISYSVGIDSVQAVQLAMKHIGDMLIRLNQNCGGTLRWEGDENGDFGFPVPI